MLAGDKANNELDRFANLLATLIEKYTDKLSLDFLPEPTRPAYA
jgi:hypothetical protein